MTSGLRRRLRIETEERDGRIVTRMWIGDDLLPGSEDLHIAAAQLALGVPVTRPNLLHSVGVLEPLADPVLTEGHRVRLADGVQVELMLSPARVVVPGPLGPTPISVRPEGPLDVDGFVPPGRLGPLQELARSLRGRWFELLSEAAATGLAVDHEAATATLRAQALRALDGAALGPILGPGDDRLYATSLQEDQLQYPVVGTRWRLGRQTGRVALPEGSAGDGGLAELGRLLGRLGHLASQADLAPLLDAVSPGVNQTWRMLGSGPWLSDVESRVSTEPVRLQGALDLGRCLLMDKSVAVHIAGYAGSELVSKGEVLLGLMGFETVVVGEAVEAPKTGRALVEGHWSFLMRPFTSWTRSDS